MTELEQAAMAYGSAAAAVDSSSGRNAPAVVQSAMRQEWESAMQELANAALTFYNNHYDGAE